MWSGNMRVKSWFKVKSVMFLANLVKIIRDSFRKLQKKLLKTRYATIISSLVSLMVS
jgi:hypothetical protein